MTNDCINESVQQTCFSFLVYLLKFLDWIPGKCKFTSSRTSWSYPIIYSPLIALGFAPFIFWKNTPNHIFIVMWFISFCKTYPLFIYFGHKKSWEHTLCTNFSPKCMAKTSFGTILCTDFVPKCMRKCVRPKTQEKSALSLVRTHETKLAQSIKERIGLCPFEVIT